MFRLHIDIPLGENEAEAAKVSNAVMEQITSSLKRDKSLAGNNDYWQMLQMITKVQYRLANDEDRSLKNYLIKDENNHVASRKTVIEL